MTPRGGTELQLEFLQKHIDKSLLDKFQICTSVPGKVPIDPSKINILWQKNSYDQTNLVDFFKETPKKRPLRHSKSYNKRVPNRKSYRGQGR